MKKLLATVAAFATLAGGVAPAFASTYSHGNHFGNFKWNVSEDSIANSDDSTANSDESTANISFEDLDSNVQQWAGAAIRQLVKEQIINGIDSFDKHGKKHRQFEPASTITRAQFAKLVVKEFDLQAPANASQDYNDVPTDSWEFPFVEAAKDYFDAFTNLNGGLNFRSNQPMNREDVAVTLVKILTKQGIIQLDSAQQAQQTLQNYTDASQISASLQPYVATAVDNNLMKGVGDKQLAPLKPLNRAQAAVLLYRIQNQFAVVPGDTTTTGTTGTTTGTTTTGTTTGTTTTDTTTAASVAISNYTPDPVENTADTLTIQALDANGAVLTSLNGTYPITVNGALSAPDGTAASFDSNATFTNGVATIAVTLPNTSAQAITVTVLSQTTAPVTITPVAAAPVSNSNESN